VNYHKITDEINNPVVNQSLPVAANKEGDIRKKRMVF
jgi:hypothetical protein